MNRDRRGVTSRGAAPRHCSRRLLAAIVVLSLSGSLAAVSQAAAPAATSHTSKTPTITGRVASINPDYSGDEPLVTIDATGRQHGAIDAMIAYATKLTDEDTPYVYGGGHAHAGTPTHGGYDCSGAVAAVLAAGGIWPKGSSVPSNSGIITELQARHLIAPGPATSLDDVTLYNIPGHISMAIAGDSFSTGGDRKGGAGWLGALEGALHGVGVYHVVTSRFRDDPATPSQVLLEAPATTSGLIALDGLAVGDTVTADYAVSKTATLSLGAVTYPGATTVSGVITSLGTNGQQVTLETPVATSSTPTTTTTTTTAGSTGPAGSTGTASASGLADPVTLTVPTFRFLAANFAPQLTKDVHIGDTVSVTTTASGSGPAVAHVIKVLSAPPQAKLTGTIASRSSDGQSFTLADSQGVDHAFVFNPSEDPISNYLPSEDKVGTKLTVTYLEAPYGLPDTVTDYES